MTRSSGPLRLRYLRHGIVRTGGARHEEYFFESIVKELEKRKLAFLADQKIAGSIFRGWDNLRLLSWGWKSCTANVNIVVGRLALSSVLRNLFSRRKTLIVLHNFDPHDGKGKLLASYYKLLFSVLKKASPDKVGIVAVSPYFRDYFKSLFPQLPVYLFPNLFDTGYYAGFRTAHHPKKVLLGQYSSKMDSSLYLLAEKLSAEGFECFFCTLRANGAAKLPAYEIKKLSFEEYLKEMAASCCSLSLSGVNEGWPRMVHESILVGTPVIGYDKGGLGDLLRESDSYIVKNEQEAFDLIVSQELEYRTSKEFICRYDTSATEQWLAPVMEFILH